jgi:hypothetical protein
MPIPAPVIAAGVQLGAQALGGALGRKKRPAAPDYSGLINTINQSGGRQRGLITGLRPKLASMTDRFSQDRRGLTNHFVDTIAGQGRNFVSDIGDASGELAQAESAAGRSRILSAQPELNQSLRETLAASGLNRGGALLAGQGRINQTLGREVGELERGVTQRSLQAKQDAIKTAFQTNASAAERATGIDADTMERVLASGREDLINEVNELIAEERNRTQSITGFQGDALRDQYTAGLADKARQQDLLNTLLQGGGNVLGQYLGHKYGTPVKAA